MLLQIFFMVFCYKPCSGKAEWTHRFCKSSESFRIPANCQTWKLNLQIIIKIIISKSFLCCNINLFNLKRCCKKTFKLASAWNSLMLFYKILQMPPQKWIVVSPNNYWSVFHRKVLFIHIDWIKVWGPLGKGLQAYWYLSEGHLEKRPLRALWLVAAFGEDSLKSVVCIYYIMFKHKLKFKAFDSHSSIWNGCSSQFWLILSICFMTLGIFFIFQMSKATAETST